MSALNQTDCNKYLEAGERKGYRNNLIDKYEKDLYYRIILNST